MRRFLAALLLACVVTTAAAANDLPDNFSFSLERTACFGSCPVYKVIVSSDGSVVYEGKQYVRIKGTRRRKIEPEAVKDLLQQFIDSDYFKFKENYSSIKNADGTETTVTDLPTTTTSLTLGNRKKQVVDYVGAPKKLKELEEKIDEVAGVKRWVAIDAPTLREEVQHGWDLATPNARQLLLDAVREGDYETVEAFIQAGADVNTLVGNIYLLQVARGVKTVKTLIAAGANVNVNSKEFDPPLSFAAAQGDADSIAVLIGAGAMVDGRNRNGMTPLMEAARSGSPEAVQALLAAGAHSNARDNQGHGALYYVRMALEHQRELVGHPEPFEEAMPDYQNKYLSIQQSLVAAGATEDAPSTK